MDVKVARHGTAEAVFIWWLVLHLAGGGWLAPVQPGVTSPVLLLPNF